MSSLAQSHLLILVYLGILLMRSNFHLSELNPRRRLLGHTLAFAIIFLKSIFRPFITWDRNILFAVSRVASRADLLVPYQKRLLDF